MLRKYRKNKSIIFLYLCTERPWLSFNFHTTCTFVHYKFSLLNCLLYAKFGLSYTADNHFKLSLSGTVKQNSELYFVLTKCQKGQSQWLHCLKCGPAAAYLLRLQVQNPPGAWVSVSFECCVLSLQWGYPSSRETHGGWYSLRWGLHQDTWHATRQQVQSVAGAWALSKLAMPITLRNENPGQLASSASIHHSTSQRRIEEF